MVTQVEILSIGGAPTGSVELPDLLFNTEVSEPALHRAVVTYEANQRQGNASTKTRSEVNRSGRKHHRQKGTGAARRGSVRSPLLRGGGVVFGPKPRNYYSKVPKSLKRLAFRSALSLKQQAQQVRVVDDFDFPQPSTKSFLGVIEACGLKDYKVLFITPDSTELLFKSCRNLPDVQISTVGTMSAYDIFAADVVLFTQVALAKLVQRWGVGESEMESEGQSE
jgi:large subunit ribosomal protein L4